MTTAQLRLHAVRLAEAIVAGDLAPSEGVRRIWVEVFSEAPDNLPDLATFVSDATDWEELPERRSEIEQHIRAEARRLVESTLGSG